VLVRAGEHWLDRAWFGRQVSTFDAIGQVLDAADEARDEGELVSRLEGALGAAMNLPVRISTSLLPAVPAQGGAAATPAAEPAGAAPARDESRVRGCHVTPVATVGASRAAGTVVGIDGGDGRGWCVTVEAGDASGALLSEDVARLRTLARVAGPMLRAMRVQQTVRAHEVRTQQLALNARRAELRALRAQIDPHFLFNALNAVAGLVHVDAERADRAVEALSEVFRYTLRASEREWARLDDELQFAQAYLDVECARFGEGRLAVSVRCDQMARAVQVPALVVQTLVENAIKHGVSHVRGLARVDVDSWIDGNDVVVTVANDGPPPPGDVLGAITGAGVPAGGVPGSGHGLGNIRARLAGYFGDAATFTLTRDAQTRATLRMPRVWDHASRATAAGSGAPAPEPA
jgi:anti-sigma regulatory factor (Ser/Thr protein kinase)